MNSRLLKELEQRITSEWDDEVSTIGDVFTVSQVVKLLMTSPVSRLFGVQRVCQASRDQHRYHETSGEEFLLGLFSASKENCSHC